MNRKMVFWRALMCDVMFAAAISLISACHQTEPSADNPDGVDPPVINPHPTKFIKIRVFAPKSLKIELDEFFEAPGHWYNGLAHLCIRDGRESAATPGHSKTVPVALKWDGEGYSGTIVVDRFLPGRCDWAFQGVFKERPTRDTLLMYMDVIANNRGPDQSTDVWCGKNPAPGESNGMICTGFGYFAKYPGQVSPALLAAVPLAIQKETGLLLIDLTTRSVTVRYHDIKAENTVATKVLP